MEENIKVIVFKLQEQNYGITIQQIRSIERLQEVTQIPRVPEFIKGVINLRGDITPIIDLKERLALGKTESTIDTRVLIVEINSVQAGLIVDSATDVIDLHESSIEPAPEMMHGVNEVYIQGVAKLENELLLILDVENILQERDMDELREVAGA